MIFKMQIRWNREEKMHLASNIKLFGKKKQEISGMCLGHNIIGDSGRFFWYKFFENTPLQMREDSTTLPIREYYHNTSS